MLPMGRLRGATRMAAALCFASAADRYAAPRYAMMPPRLIRRYHALLIFALPCRALLYLRCHAILLMPTMLLPLLRYHIFQRLMIYFSYAFFLRLPFSLLMLLP